MQVWTYVITVDKGGAPNFEPPMTTLAICKPRIRKHARQGDLVLAFNGTTLNPAEPHSVRWAGVVSKVMPFAQYWNDPIFQNKSDNIYRPTKGGELEQIRNEWHGKESAERDVGGRNVLIFGSSWCFRHTVAVLPKMYELRMISGRRGHRCVELDNGAWRDLRQWLDANECADPGDRTFDEGKRGRLSQRRSQCL